jgi:hypothetical protein
MQRVYYILRATPSKWLGLADPVGFYCLIMVVSLCLSCLFSYTPLIWPIFYDVLSNVLLYFLPHLYGK